MLKILVAIASYLVSWFMNTWKALALVMKWLPSFHSRGVRYDSQHTIVLFRRITQTHSCCDMLLRYVYYRKKIGQEVQMDIARVLVGLLVLTGALLLGVGFAGDPSDAQIITGFVFLGLGGLLASLALGRPVP